MRVYIGGGSGFIGSHISRKLLQKGHSVVTISRTEGPNTISWINLQKYGLPEDCEAVLNLAGENLMNPAKRWNESFKESLEGSRIGTTKILADLISQTKFKPKVWVSSSAIGYYPPSETIKYDENSVGGKGDFLAELCAKWENAATTDSSVRHAVVRIGIALGRHGGTIQQLMLPFVCGIGGKIASGNQWFPWVHVEDAAGIFVYAIENENVSGVLNAVAPQAITNKEFTEAFAKALKKPSFLTVPEGAMKLIYGEERAAAVTKGQNVYPKRTLELGYKFEYPDIRTAAAEFSRFYY